MTKSRRNTQWNRAVGQYKRQYPHVPEHVIRSTIMMAASARRAFLAQVESNLVGNERYAARIAAGKDR